MSFNGNILCKAVLISAGILLGLSFCSNAWANDGNLFQMEDEMFTPAVKIADGMKGFCSGEVIYSDRVKKTGDVETVVLTAKHCVQKRSIGSKLQVLQQEYDDTLRRTKTNAYDAIVDQKCPESDIAFIKLKGDYIFNKVAKLAKGDTPLSFGQSVWTVGYPLGLSRTLTKGTLGFVEDQNFGSISKSHEFFRATPDIAPGSSGSSMFTKVDGEYQIIGVTTGGWNLGTYMNYFTPVDEVNACWDHYNWRLDSVKEKKAAE